MTIGELCEPDAELADSHLLQTLLTIYLLLIPAGTVFFRYCSLETGLPMTPDRAFFWTLSSITCTGFRVSVNGLDDMSRMGHAGTMALMLFGAFFSLCAGGLMVCRILELPHSRKKIITAAVAFLAIASAAGGGLLMTPGRSLFAAVFESISCVTNTGLSIDGGRTLFDPRLYIAVLPLSVLGSLGLPVIIELAEWFAASRPLSEYTRLILRLTAGAWVVGFAVLALCGMSLSLRDNLAASWFYAVDTRSLGTDVYLPSALPRAMWWMMTLLMLVGGAPASPTGGVRLTTLWLLGSGSRRLLRGQPAGRSLGAAILYAGIFLACALALFLFLACSEAQLPTDRLATIAAGAISTTGMSHDPLSTTGGPLCAISLAMCVGQLLPVGFAWWMRRTGKWDMAVS